MKINNLLKNSFIVGSTRASTMLITFATTIALAQLLTPHDFGTVAMCSLFFSIASVLVESGLGGSIIYHKDNDEDDYHTVFWFNMAVSIILYIILFACSGAIASFYGIPMLSCIIKISGLSFVIHSTCLIQSTLLSKGLKFKITSKILLLSSVITSILTIALAFILKERKLGIYALAFQQVLLYFFQSLLFIHYGSYRPRFRFSWNKLKKHWNFGSKLLGTSLIKITYDNIYIQIIGKVIGIDGAGYYNQAKKINDVPTNIIQNPLETVLFPSLVNAKDFNEKTKIITNSFAIVMIPSISLLALLANNLVLLCLGKEWMESGWMLSMMLWGTIGAALENLNRNFIKATGKTEVILKTDCIKRAICLAIICCSIYWGIKGILIAFIINGFLGWLINCWIVHRICENKLLDQIKTAIIYCLIFCSLFFILSFLDNKIEVNNIQHIAIKTVAYICLTATILFAFRRKDIKDFSSFIKQK